MIAHRDRDYCQINDLLEIVATTRNKQSEPFMTKRLFFAKNRVYRGSKTRLNSCIRSLWPKNEIYVVRIRAIGRGDFIEAFLLND